MLLGTVCGLLLDIGLSLSMEGALVVGGVAAAGLVLDALEVEFELPSVVWLHLGSEVEVGGEVGDEVFADEVVAALVGVIED